MIKLLKGDFIRLFESKVFWLGIIFMVGLASMAVCTKWSELKSLPALYNPPDGILLAGAAYIGIVIAVFIGIFIGSDYSNGTIRNKHVMGHSRLAMYLSNLVICVTASVILHIAYIAVVLVAEGIGMIGKFEMSAGNIAVLIVTSFFTIAAISSVILLVCMLITGRSIGSVSAIVLSLMMIVGSNSIYYRLLEKEYTTPYQFTVMNEYGEEIEVEQESVPNPRYLTGTKRKIYAFLNDLLPNNQIMQLSNGASGKQLGDDGEIPNHTAWFPLYSLTLITVVTAAGVLLFRRKNLK